MTGLEGIGPPGDEMLNRLTKWAERDDRIRALVLTSSRANPSAAVDRLSDYDVIVVVSDLRLFAEDEAWLRDNGTPLSIFRDDDSNHGVASVTRLVLYEDGTKVDHAVWPVEKLARVLEEPVLPAYLDLGYRVLVDKDGLASQLKPPTHRAFIPRPPTQAEYLALVEEFWWETTYVARNLWRGDLFGARYSLDVVIRQDLLIRMLVWHLETRHGWSVRPGSHGRRMKALVEPEVWVEVERTFVGPGVEENWRALFHTADLFRRLARHVAASLGHEYPESLDRGVSGYLEHIRVLPAGS